MKCSFVGALVALSVIAAPPAVAADFSSAAAFDPRPAAFGGVTVRVPLGEERKAKPQARLQLTTYQPGSANSWRGRNFSRSGLELGVSPSGKPMLLAGGISTGQAKQKMGLDKTTTWVIVGGVLLVLVIVAVAAGGAGMGDTCPEIDGSRDHCIDP